MIGLGALSGRASDPAQPPLVDGIHLRWSFARQLGYPWHGFYLFRRKHTPGKALCLTAGLRNVPNGAHGRTLSTAYGVATSDQPIVTTDAVAPLGQPEISLSGRRYLRVLLVPSPACHVRVRVRFLDAATTTIRAFGSSTVVMTRDIAGRAGQEVEETFDFDALTSVELSGGPVALLDVCFSPVIQDTVPSSHWDPVPDFPTPMRLPVAEPDYPCTPGATEDLESARTLARSRIHYGDPDTFTRPPISLTATGAIDVVSGSPLVLGHGTAWTTDHVGGLLRVVGDATGYTVAAVISLDHLVLNRRYNGPSLANAAFHIDDDPFGQLHDHLGHLTSGGPGAGTMASRSLPDAVSISGSVSVHKDSLFVDGSATAWGRQLEGLSLRVGRKSVGSVNVSAGSVYVFGFSTFFDASHAGLLLRIAGDTKTYQIRDVYSPDWIRLDRGYEGASDGGVSYTLTDPDLYTIVEVSSSTRLKLSAAYRRRSGSGRPYAVVAALRSDDDSGPAAVMPRQVPLDLTLLGSISAAVAQMLGLYWIDRTAVLGEAYDYMIVADRTGVGTNDPWALLAHLATSQFSDVDAFIAYGLKIDVAPTLEPPAFTHAYALPTSTIVGGDNALVAAAGNIGLTWDVPRDASGKLVPGAPVAYLVWRAGLGATAENPPPRSSYVQITQDPVLIVPPRPTTPPLPAAPSDWPSLSLCFVDRGLDEGWYCHQVTSLDLFGRYSRRSHPAQWMEWVPQPDPRPWYYVDPPGSAVHPFAVRLLDQLGPPPPAAVEASALDPADPTLLRDAAYLSWRASLPLDERDTRVGLRVCWLWTAAHQRQAPDLREFRVYLQPGALNSEPVRVVDVLATDPVESEVELDLTSAPDGAFVGAALFSAGVSYSVLSSSTGRRVRLRVRNTGPDRSRRPIHGDARILISSTYSDGTVTVTHGSVDVVGDRTRWTSALVGKRVSLDGDPATYLVARVTSPTTLTLDRPCSGASGARRRYAIVHPRFTDYSRATSWSERCLVVAPDEHVETTADGDRRYEVFLDAPTGSFIPTVDEPVTRMAIGVSAADNRDHASDDPTWSSGAWGGRYGNEGRVGGPAMVFRVRRVPPPTPETIAHATRLTASRADYQAQSFHTYRWRPQPALRLHILRAVDESVFLVDRARRPRVPLDPDNDAALFPFELLPNAGQVVAELNALNTSALAEDYRALSDDALRVLAGLPGNERAFVQLTVDGLDGEADRRGPDDPIGYSPDPSVRAFVDVLDGRASNRYFYRSVFVDGAHNRGALTLSGPPVYLPKVSPPRAPSVSRLIGGDRRITVRWTSNREPDLVLYRVYRAGDEESAGDLRRMAIVHTAPVPPGVPTSRPAELELVDTVSPHTTYYYRLTAVDDAGNESLPSRAFAARAFDDSRPPAPDWSASSSITAGAVGLSWNAADSGLRCLVQRRHVDDAEWENLSGWLSRGSYAYEDRTRGAGQVYVYRLRVLDEHGRSNATFHELTV